MKSTIARVAQYGLTFAGATLLFGASFALAANYVGGPGKDNPDGTQFHDDFDLKGNNDSAKGFGGGDTFHMGDDPDNACGGDGDDIMYGEGGGDTYNIACNGGLEEALALTLCPVAAAVTVYVGAATLTCFRVTPTMTGLMV